MDKTYGGVFHAKSLVIEAIGTVTVFYAGDEWLGVKYEGEIPPTVNGEELPEIQVFDKFPVLQP